MKVRIAPVALITFTLLTGCTGDWEKQCASNGGHVVRHRDGYITTIQHTYDSHGRIKGSYPIRQPRYSYTCERAGRVISRHG